MPTSISHLGGRARVNEPGRYRKKNNKNLMAQGLPTYVGMPQPLRNLIAKRVKPSQAVTERKKKSCICDTSCAQTVSPEAGQTITGTLAATTKGVFGCNNNYATVVNLFRNLNNLDSMCRSDAFCCLGSSGTGSCPPPGMGFDVFAYESVPSGNLHKIWVAIWGTNNAPVGWTAPTTIQGITVTRPGLNLQTNAPANPPVPSFNILGGPGFPFPINLSAQPGAGPIPDYLKLDGTPGCTAIATGAVPLQAGEWSFAVAGLANTILPGDTVAVILG